LRVSASRAGQYADVQQDGADTFRSSQAGIGHGYHGATNSIGTETSCISRSTCPTQCRCGPLENPLLPDVPSCWPTRTRYPAEAMALCQCRCVWTPMLRSLCSTRTEVARIGVTRVAGPVSRRPRCGRSLAQTPAAARPTKRIFSRPGHRNATLLDLTQYCSPERVRRDVGDLCGSLADRGYRPPKLCDAYQLFLAERTFGRSAQVYGAPTFGRKPECQQRSRAATELARSLRVISIQRH